jgi:hypothetical protein
MSLVIESIKTMVNPVHATRKVICLYYFFKVHQLYSSIYSTTAKFRRSMFMELESTISKLFQEITSISLHNGNEFITCTFLSGSITFEDLIRFWINEFRSKCSLLINDSIPHNLKKWILVLYRSIIGNVKRPVVHSSDTTAFVLYHVIPDHVQTRPIEIVTVNRFLCNMMPRFDADYLACDDLSIEGVCPRLFSKMERTVEQSFIKFDVVSQLEMRNYVADIRDVMIDFYGDLYFPFLVFTWYVIIYLFTSYFHFKRRNQVNEDFLLEYHLKSKVYPIKND